MISTFGENAPIWVKLRNGQRECRPPVVDSDDELIDLIRRTAAQRGRGCTFVRTTKLAPLMRSLASRASIPRCRSQRGWGCITRSTKLALLMRSLASRASIPRCTDRNGASGAFASSELVLLRVVGSSLVSFGRRREPSRASPFRSVWCLLRSLYGLLLLRSVLATIPLGIYCSHGLVQKTILDPTHQTNQGGYAPPPLLSSEVANVRLLLWTHPR